MSVMTGSSSSNSLRSVAQPSTTRNTSPNGSVGRRRPGLAARAAGTTPSSRCPARRTALPLGQQGRDLADGAPDADRVEPAGHPADVRQVAQRGQRAAAEVEAVDLHLGRGVGQRQPADQRAQRGRLAALRRRRPSRRARPRRPACSHSTSRSCSRGLSIERDRHLQRAVQLRVGEGQAAHRVDGDRAEQLVERRRTGSSGGSQTWCAGGPWPASRSTITSSRLSPAGDLVRLGLRPA